MDQDKKPRPRILVTFDQLTFELIHEAAEATGLPASHIVNQLMHAHVEELIEFNGWIKHQEGDNRARGIHALDPYGPSSLITEMKRIDPTYQPQSERLLAQVKGEGLDGDELADLRAMLGEWKAKRTKGAKR